jgi:glycosyltransferase involved in cell wall biosynthesis
MKICQVVASRGTGGLERHFVDLCNQLARRHEVVAIAHPEFRGRLDAAVQFHALDLSGWRYNPAALFGLYRVLRRHRPQLVHAQANKAAAMVGLLRPFIRGGFVATVHNLKRDTGMFRPFDRVIAVSRRAAAQLDHAHVDVVYNGIDPPSLPADTGTGYLQSALGREKLEPPVVIAVGRLVPAKGFDILLRAWQALPATLVIAGDGPERSRLEGMIRDYGLGDRVILAGYRRDVPALMASADLMVIASRNEGFPYVLVEGLHVRRIIIATRVPGALDMLPDAFLVDYGSPEQLVAAVRRVLDDVEGARQAFMPVWALAARELTVTRMVERTEEVYAKVPAVS